jgi:uncharacterized LabA/DUF88 family protein
MRTIVYIDGFNLYYRLLKERPQYKWLNPLMLARNMLSDAHDVVRINYYTARVSARTYDPDAPARQATYLKALSSVPQIRIHEGNFLVTNTWMPLAEPPDARPKPYEWNEPTPEVVRVVKTEEKGSDVNLAAHLVRDAYTDAFDVAILLTNDSDLVEPVRIVTQDVGKRVGLFVPVKSPTASLVAVSSFQLHLRPGLLGRAQFPDEIPLADGTSVKRPPNWVSSEYVQERDRAAKLEALDAALMRGIADAEAGRTKPIDEVFKRLSAKLASPEQNPDE